MMKKQEAIENITQTFVRQIKTTWQIFFLIPVFLYLLSMLHSFLIQPPLRISDITILKNIDLLSFFIALILALWIFRLKRKYLSARYSHRVTEDALQTRSEISLEDILQQIFSTLTEKMRLVWALGGLLILDGVIFYWVTYSSRNMHLYFIIGVFSLFLNYPRRELFADIPLFVMDARKRIREEGE
ncbi:MAG: hypothetical protein D6748_12235 [Calditrichaeota bacterium]|nr:MAG: hypothetical protein D6748_12235 [Calditrichota bacterium]